MLRRNFIKAFLTVSMCSSLALSFSSNLVKEEIIHGWYGIGERDFGDLYRLSIKIPGGDYISVTTRREDSVHPMVRKAMLERLRQEYHREIMKL